MKICAKCKASFEEGIAYCPTDGARLTTVSKLQTAGESVPEEAVKAAAQAAKESGVEDLTGRTVAGRYQVIRRLGEGGMGIVYRAVDTRLEKEVAIKVLKEDFAHRTDVVARFTQEAKSAARIKHENVLDVTDYGQTEDGSFYIAMELLVGTDLADVLQKHGTIDPTRAINIMIQVTRALSAAHGKGIVHRDLKPENIFLVAGEDAREVVKIVDFGIAQMKDMSGGGGNADTSRKLTRTGMIFGTPEYMSPEQAAGKVIDHRVDVYAIGVIMYETLAGRVPFVGDTFMGVLTQHMFENAPAIKSIKPDANVPAELESIIAKALAKDPTHRYQTMQEVTDDLVRMRDGQKPMASGAVIPGVARPTAAGYGSATVPDMTGSITPAVPISHTLEVEAPRSRKTVALLIGLGALALVGGGAAVATSLSSRANGGSVPVVTASNGTGSTHVASGGGTGATGGGTALVTADANAGGTVMAAHDAGAAQGSDPNVTVHVASTPVTARVEVEGTSALRCDATPCDLRLPRGQQVRLIATAAHKRGELPLTPDHDGESVSIAMNTIGGGTHGGGHPSGGGSNGGSSNSHARSTCRPGQLHLDPGTGLMVPCFVSGGH